MVSQPVYDDFLLKNIFMSVSVCVNQTATFIVIFFRPLLLGERFKQREKFVALLDADRQGHMIPWYTKSLLEVPGSRFRWLQG